MTKFLLDASLSRRLAAELRAVLGLDIDRLSERGLATVSDADVVALAKQEQRVIITFDKDFGESYYLRERGTIGVIILRLPDQRRMAVRDILYRFFTNFAAQTALDGLLVVVEQDRVRIASPPDS